MPGPCCSWQLLWGAAGALVIAVGTPRSGGYAAWHYLRGDRDRVRRGAIVARRAVPNLDPPRLRKGAFCTDHPADLRMRVALIDPSLFTLPYDVALAKGLRLAGCEVVLYGRPTHPTDGGSDGVDLAAHFYPLAENRFVRQLPKAARLAIKGFDHFISMTRLWRRLTVTRPDVIHFQWLALPFIDNNFLARFRRIAPLVLTVHDTDPFNGNPAARLQRVGGQRSFAHFDQLIVHTSQGRARLLQQGAPAESTAILPHGSLSSAPLAAADAMQGPVTLMLFGKIKPYKGADILIDAFAALPPALRGDVRVRIVGQSYMDLNPLREQASALGVAQSVSIEPVFVADDEVDHLFGPGAIAVFPYREIEASGVLSYAIANGRPIIASRLGSFAEMLVDGIHGRLVPAGDVPALTTALAALLADRAAAASCAAAVAALSSDVPGWGEIARRDAVDLSAGCA